LTGGTVTPTQPPSTEQFFDTGDWITLGVGILAALIAYLSWRASVRSARAAERSAEATEDAVEEQRKANALATERDRREQQAQEETRRQTELEERSRLDAAEKLTLDHARRITVQYFVNAGNRCVDP
jgi:flagellar biosynthesis/type III secretory pathway M-ring protein FliF/YscJ